ncbi:MAG TPA: hypothetical protein VFV19_17155 [Candidatus Polarisedimenticolaceae bacterium]|nr:hypothetical protein [Candidatus Polarisedimenticolaceae bacterium]
MKALAAAVLVAAVARGAVANCQLGGTACGDPVAVDCNNGTVCFPPYRTCASCTCTTTNEGKTCLSNTSEPGTVATVLVAKSVAVPGDLDLEWTASCRAAATDYGIYEGVLTSWYSHEPRQCSSGGLLSATIAPTAGDHYYLVVAISSDFMGSLGTSSSGTERPDGLGSCGSDRAFAPCP